MAKGRDVTEWKWSQWAGTLGQLHEAAALAQIKVQAQSAELGDHVEVEVRERHGYSHHAENLDYLTQISERDIGQIERVEVTIGRTYSGPGVEIRASEFGLSVQVAGSERTWTAGLRHELEQVLRPRWRLHAPGMGDPGWAVGATPFVFLGVWIGLAAILASGNVWTETARVLFSLGAGALSALALSGTIWASARTLELLPKGAMPRYQRWRKMVLAGVGAVVVGIIASALYGLLS